MEQSLWAALCRFARGDNSVFGGEVAEPGDASHGELDPNDPLTFSRFCVYLAVHRLDLPVATYDQAFTEGRGELGFDGIVISLGGEPLPGPERIEETVENLLVGREAVGARGAVDPSAVPEPRALFVQAKRESVTLMREVDHFGASAERFLAFDEDAFRSLSPNPEVLHWWRIFDGIRRVYERYGIRFEPRVDLVFAYAGRWTEPVGPEASRSMAERHLGQVVRPEKVRYRMWGCDELNQAVEWTTKAVCGVLKSPQLIRLPDDVAEAYIGYVSAESMVDLIPDAGGRPDERVFLDNVRSFLGDDQKKALMPNPGAVGLSRTLNCGEGNEVILRHNGVTIVTRGMEERENGDRELREFQIVNGAQTTFVLCRNRDLLPGVHVPVKIVVTEDDEVKNGVILGANTQAPVGQYDMLARLREVRLLHQAFNAFSSNRPEKIWLQRRRREWIPAQGYRELRYATPRQLMEGFAAAFLGIPHRVHNEPSLLFQFVPERIFSTEHDPSVYRAVAWLVATGRRWARRETEYRWAAGDNRDPKSYPARHQYVYALRLLVDSSPDQSDLVLTRGSRPVNERFERICRLLAGPEGPRFGIAAATVVEEAALGKRLSTALTRRRDFTDQVFEMARKKRAFLETAES